MVANLHNGRPVIDCPPDVVLTHDARFADLIVQRIRRELSRPIQPEKFSEKIDPWGYFSMTFNKHTFSMSVDFTDAELPMDDYDWIDDPRCQEDEQIRYTAKRAGICWTEGGRMLALFTVELVWREPDGIDIKPLGGGQ
jgi:hypothetical protein